MAKVRQNQKTRNNQHPQKKERLKSEDWKTLIVFLVVFSTPFVILGLNYYQSHQKIDQGEVLGASDATIVQTPNQADQVPDKFIEETAKQFIVRLKTYTNRDEYANLKALRTLVTPEYAQELQSIIEENTRKRSNDSGEDFFGVVTSVLDSSIVQRTNEVVVVLVKTEEIEITTEKPNKRISLRNFTVTLSYIEHEWRVEGFKPVSE